jgi:Tfp pilus assembly protein PilX
MRLRSRPRPSAAGDERGFSLVVALLVLAASTLLLFGAIDAVLFNVQPTRNNLDQKRALLAAEGGLSAYEQQLNQNQDYWDTCPGANGATGVTTTVGQTPASVPGSTDDGSTEYYTYAELPATGTTYTGCSTTNPASVVQASTAAASHTFRVKVTGYSNPTNGTALINRTIVAQFKPTSFLNYVYFTNHESEDPTYGTGPGGIPFGSGDAVNGPLHSNDTISCVSSTNVTFGRTSADAIETPNTISNNNCPSTTTGTQENQANGGWSDLPLPSNDAQLLEVADGGNSTLGSSSALASDCSSTAGCVFDGPTTIVLDGPKSSANATNQMTVTNGGITATLPYPANGVVFVNTTSACSSYGYSPYGSENQLYGNTTLDPAYAYTSNSADTDNKGCGDVVVQQSPYTGSAGGPSSTSCGVSTITVNSVAMCPYTQSLTIDAWNDIIVASPLVTTSTTSSSSCYGESGGCPTGTALLGLVANDMVRIFHPVAGTRSSEVENTCPTSNNTNGTGSLVNPVIDAALMSVDDSFIIDNFDCGNSNTNITTPLGNLTINGAVVQNYRGRIGENGSNGNYTGYIKNYWYDERLQTLEPPFFLDPTSDSWGVDRLTECDSSSSC